MEGPVSGPSFVFILSPSPKNRKNLNIYIKKVCFSEMPVLYYLGDKFIIRYYAKNQVPMEHLKHFERGNIRDVSQVCLSVY